MTDLGAIQECLTVCENVENTTQKLNKTGVHIPYLSPRKKSCAWCIYKNGVERKEEHIYIRH